MGDSFTAGDEAYLGLDFGGTKLAAGVVDSRGRLIARDRAPTEPAAGPAGAVDRMLGLVRTILPPEARVVAAGVSFGGPVHPDRERTLLSHHGPDWEDYPLVARLRSALGVPVAMDNDANLGALGEWA